MVGSANPTTITIVMTVNNMNYLTAEDVVALHYALVKDFAVQRDPISPAGPRDINLLHSALGRPRTALGANEKYNRIETKAAALLNSLIMNHPFHNGNKRTALVSMLVFLDKNSRRLIADDDDILNFIILVASRESPYNASADEVIDAMAEWLRKHLAPVRNEPSSMPIKDFIQSCISAGAVCRSRGKGGGWIIMGPHKRSKGSIKLSGSTNRLDGSAIKRYLQRLGLSEGTAGILVDEFQEGLDPNQKIIRDYRTVLKRLAYR